MMDELFDITVTEPGDVIKELPSDVEIVIETISTEESETIFEGTEPAVIEPEPTIFEDVEPTIEPEPAVIETEVPATKEPDPEVIRADPEVVVAEPVKAPRKRRFLLPEEAQAIRVHYKD